MIIGCRFRIRGFRGPWSGGQGPGLKRSRFRCKVCASRFRVRGSRVRAITELRLRAGYDDVEFEV
jgi:hypothetical protein